SLVNGLDIVCTWHQSGCHAENLLLQVWASLYRFKRSVKTVEFRSYKHIKNRAFHALYSRQVARLLWQRYRARIVFCGPLAGNIAGHIID
ncbi:MAG: hypothetical protein KUG53_02715, partial [Pseudomonadales bacterium]|nr:hypothetical protein [Pseudomonadales bacterium]